MIHSVGSPALTSRGMKENDFKQVAMFIDEGVQLGIEAKTKAGMWGGYYPFCDLI